MTTALQDAAAQAIEILEQVVINMPILPVQPGTPYDDVWIALQSLRQAAHTMEKHANDDRNR